MDQNEVMKWALVQEFNKMKREHWDIRTEKKLLQMTGKMLTDAIGSMR